MLWALVRGAGLDVRHPLVAMVSFTPYVAATAPLPVMAALLLRRWIVAGAAAVAAVALAVAVLPRAFGGPHAASADSAAPVLTVMTSNLQYGQGDPRAVVRLVRERRVDVLSLQELTPAAVSRLERAGLRGELPGRILDTRPGAAGSGLYARRRLRPSGPPDMTGAAQPEGRLTVPGLGPVQVKTTHPPPPISRDAVGDWKRLLGMLPGPRDGDVPRILAGDFNGTLDHRAIRRVLDRGWYDAAGETGEGLKTTWPADRARPEITIDHVLVPPPLRVRRVTVHDVPGSDHRAVIAEIVPPER